MMRWKWQNRQRFDKDKRRPISGRRCPANSGNLVNFDIMDNLSGLAAPRLL